MRIPVSIITALVLEIDVDAIFHVINILLDDICNINVLFICGKVSFICPLPLNNERFYFSLLQVRQDSYKVVGNVHIKMFSLLSYLVDNPLDLLLCEPLPLAELKPLLRGLLTKICNYLLIGCEVEPLRYYFLPVVVLLSIVFFEEINLF
jgi:hypothetical protein